MDGLFGLIIEPQTGNNFLHLTLLKFEHWLRRLVPGIFQLNRLNGYLRTYSGANRYNLGMVEGTLMKHEEATIFVRLFLRAAFFLLILTGGAWLVNDVLKLIRTY